MNVTKIKENLIKMFVFVLNLALVAGGVLFFKHKDQQKNEAKIEQENAQNESVAKYETDLIQQALADSNVLKEQNIAENPASITKQETVMVKKTIPAVTKEVKTTKPSSSKTTSTS